MTIKFVHFADFHLGVDTHGPQDPETRLNGRVVDFLQSLDTLIDFSIEEDVDLALFAGDAYHVCNPNPTLQREFGERIIRLSEQCPVVILVGNHDMPGALEKASAVDVFSVLKVPNVIIGNDYKVHNVKTKNGVVQVATFPYPTKQQFLEPDEMKLEDSNELFKERLVETIHNFKIDRSVPALFLGHFSVDNAIFGSEQDMAIGIGAEISINDLPTCYQYVALGHIHHHQCLRKESPVIYAGSLDRVSFSEEDDDKGFMLGEIDDGWSHAKWEFVSVDPRPFVTINVGVLSSQSPTNKVISKIEKIDVKDAVVRVIVSIPETMTASLHQERIVKALNKAGAYFIHSIKMEIIREARTRVELDDGETIASIPKLDLIDMFFQSMEIDEEDRDRLLDLAVDIMEEA